MYGEGLMRRSKLTEFVGPPNEEEALPSPLGRGTPAAAPLFFLMGLDDEKSSS